MKAVMLFIALLVSAAVVSGQEKKDGYDERIENILKLAVKNLKATLQAGSDELKESAMEAVTDLKREYPNAKFSGTVIPLMQILRSHPEQNMRILAALVLKEIGDDRGLYAIKEASQYDTHGVVRHICASIQAEKK
jgi:nitrogen fixation/metabolism regulation signal transduction histidine kinase